ncbi:Glucosaminyl phosphatidylinositol (GlcN-PI) nositol acylation protein [Komagataella phaffii CBS 7435]|uniref:GPI-anchored wall transfer protein n=2 Tax=Komagataella phaffii TaxID=460519 RepID=C4R4C7_KOMPG|nr:Protein involved in the inositol acylation of glucosaminyl phosphatidylinositol (GlcN-PI) [Komagataella phaffii GS115]AOA63874.1 GQ67_03433T0 [Komagataella phaffii]CAH2449836.1 Glucosaminyl phosphatidylinositol (GlcN-PI) nositol acylation protein [Komagataella phaffii CBS 7435]AOA68333.1 GQ68_03402T0 [Komagataella phaffii GS115]CAY70413.1 Protein involved in the inositol acylation of glucosaminyl phosphatidylinositol (GlcN-PI) [Komagataella phaffii GS115]CCA39798.1 Glucosaminyl phosphatidyl
MSTLKERKEEFVSDLTGGSISEIYVVTFVSLLSYIAWCWLKQRTSVFDTRSILGSLLDFALNWNSLLLSITLYSARPLTLNVLIILPCLALSFIKWKKGNEPSNRHIRGALSLQSLSVKQFLPHKPFITVYRSQMMVITCLAILAVDFKIFPRRFAKVETWGTSLMDLGVGSFVFSMGLVSCRSVLAATFTKSKTFTASQLIHTLVGVTPVFVLGLFRSISVKSLDYQEHVTEYGKHWNFFFTLGFLPPIAVLLSPLTKFIPHFWLSLLIGGFYEFILVNTNLLHYILLAPRVDLISDNKEGIFSLFGYLSIFLGGQATGLFLLPVCKTRNNLFWPSSKNEVVRFQSSPHPFKLLSLSVSPFQGLVYLATFYHVSFYVINTCYIYTVSRRVANLLYILWVCGYNTTFLAGYVLVDQYFWPNSDVKFTDQPLTPLQEERYNNVSKLIYVQRTPPILHALNNNSLLIFLAANLSTGVINMALNTLDCTDGKAIVVLIGYELFLASLSGLLLYFNIVIR